MLKLFFKDGCRYIYLTGYGCLSRYFLVLLSKYPDIDLFIQGIGRQFEAIEPRLAYDLTQIPRHDQQKEWDVTFHLMPAPHIEPLKGINFCYTQNAISRVRPDWLEPLRKMHLIIVPSEFDKKAFEAEGLGNVHIVPQAVDHNLFTRKSDPPNEPFTFLNVGTFNFRKGQDILLKAFKIAFGDNPKFHLYFKTGRGEFTELFQNSLKEVGLKGNNITLDQRLDSHMEMANLYNQVHCLVNPSRGEGWNMPVMEAMSCELPAISTKATAMLEYMTDQNSYPVEAQPTAIKDYKHTWWSHGWLEGYKTIPDGCLYETSPEILAETMMAVYEDYNEAKKKAKQGRKDVIDKWSWESATKKLHDLIVQQYEEVKKNFRGNIIEESRQIMDLLYK